MTQLLRRAFEAVSVLPDERQDELAQLLLDLAEDDDGVYVLSPEERADLDNSIAAEQRGEMATEEDVRALWAKYER